MPALRDRRRLKGYGLALLAAACWATGGLTAKWLFTTASSENAGWPIPPLGIALEPTALSGGRALSAFLILLAYLAVTRRDALRVSVRELPFFAVFGILGMAGVHYTYFKTISLTNVATAILLEYLAPVLVLVVSVVFLKHKLTWTLPLGVALSVTGCALVVGAIGGQGMVVSPAGVAWGLASAVFFATYSLMGSWAATRFSPFKTLVFGLGFASVFWLAVLGPASVLGVFGEAQTAFAVLFVAVVSTIIPFTAFLAALRYIAPTNATVTSTVEPVIAGIGAFALFGEALTPLQLIGGALVVAAIAVVQLPERNPAPMLPPQD
ncbi:MAG TPA: EamA family transporter [Coriobacteriia bacterium]|nr:EamA family transporter [Coriobacteriia bacterium]